MLLKRIWRITRLVLILFIAVVVLARSNYLAVGLSAKVQAFIRWEEFNYVSWTLDALGLKQSAASMALPRYIGTDQGRVIVIKYLDLVHQLDVVEDQIANIYADPAVSDPAKASASLLEKQKFIEAEIESQAVLAEAVLQHQISLVAAEMGLGLGGQLVPPLLYHVTPLPYALIVSPREIIRQDTDKSLLPELNLEQITGIEEKVEDGLGVSALVVPVGGIGIYPTMVMSTTDLNWLVEVVAHEWIHNYLTLRPVGALYYSSPELRIINETAASIAGKEIGERVIARFYPERMPPPPRPVPFEELYPQPPARDDLAGRFNYRAEMRKTRVTVDDLLAQGKITEAEEYMEARRLFFWENGYRIRKLNQAYFAFYGAYADSPGGAAGKDPVGAAVRILRAESTSLKMFLQKLTWVTSFTALLNQISPDP